MPLPTQTNGYTIVDTDWNAVINAINTLVTDVDAVEASAKFSLLKAASGTTTDASAENVDTYALASGLTAKDRLLVFWTAISVTQGTTLPRLYNATDSLGLGGLRSTGTGFAGDDFAAGDNIAGVTLLQQGQSGATAVFVTKLAALGASQAFGELVTFSTNWTGAWTLALRHGGVVSGGTFKWTWAVYKLSGQ